MNKKLTKKTWVRFCHQATLVGVTLLVTFLPSLPAWAEDGLVVKLYACPQGQAAATAENLRNEFGVIPGVRVAADERTARVIVQAPPEVQSRISQRMATTFPALQPLPEKPAAGQTESRDIHLNRIQPDQLETALWTTLGNRLTAMPQQRATLRGYRLALSTPGQVTIWIDFSAKQVKLEGSTAGVDAAARLINILDLPQDPAGRNVRLMPVQAAQVANVRRAASLMRTASGEPAVSLPLAAMLLQAKPEAPAAGGNPPILPPIPQAPAPQPRIPAAPGNPAGEKQPDLSNLSRIVNLFEEPDYRPDPQTAGPTGQGIRFERADRSHV